MTIAHQSRTAKADQKFINQALSSGMLVIGASRLALRQERLPANVAHAAQVMIDDHTPADERLARIAAGKGFTVPTTPTARDEGKLDKLSSKNGEGDDFIKAYDALLVKCHKNAIKLFEDEAKDTDDPELREFANNLLPTLRAHAELVDSLPYAKEEHEWWKFW